MTTISAFRDFTLDVSGIAGTSVFRLDGKNSTDEFISTALADGDNTSSIFYIEIGNGCSHSQPLTCPCNNHCYSEMVISSNPETGYAVLVLWHMLATAPKYPPVKDPGILWNPHSGIWIHKRHAIPHALCYRVIQEYLSLEGDVPTQVHWSAFNADQHGPRPSTYEAEY